MRDLLDSMDRPAHNDWERMRHPAQHSQQQQQQQQAPASMHAGARTSLTPPRLDLSLICRHVSPESAPSPESLTTTHSLHSYTPARESVQRNKYPDSPQPQGSLPRHSTYPGSHSSPQQQQQQPAVQLPKHQSDQYEMRLPWNPAAQATEQLPFRRVKGVYPNAGVMPEARRKLLAITDHDEPEEGALEAARQVPPAPVRTGHRHPMGLGLLPKIPSSAPPVPEPSPAPGRSKV